MSQLVIVLCTRSLWLNIIILRKVGSGSSEEDCRRTSLLRYNEELEHSAARTKYLLPTTQKPSQYNGYLINVGLALKSRNVHHQCQHDVFVHFYILLLYLDDSMVRVHGLQWSFGLSCQ